MDIEIFNRVREFTVKQAGVSEDDVCETACLERDLGIYGDDAIEYLIAFGKAFNVDVSKFMAADYFSPEGDIILPGIIRAITGKKRQRRKELSIAHLIKAIKAGRLDEEIINSHDFENGSLFEE